MGTDEKRFSLAGPWRDLRAAAGFLTRLPVTPADLPPGRDYLARAMGMFPIVGAGVGVAGALALLAAAQFNLHSLACALFAVAVMAFVTGALHEDGLADAADGIGGGQTPEDRLDIMRDSRIGAFGVLALIVSVGLRAAIVAGLFTPLDAALALVAAASVSRATLPFVCAGSRPARTEGLAAEAGKPKAPALALAAASAAVIAFLVLDFGTALAVLVACGLAAAAAAALMARAIGGYTGDTLGAVQQKAEIVALAIIAALA